MNDDPADAADALLAERLKSLGHPARLAIVRMLAVRRRCVCGEVVAGLPLAQATVSQHLKVLKEAGLVVGEIEGSRTCYCLDPVAVTRLRADVVAFLDEAFSKEPLGETAP